MSRMVEYIEEFFLDDTGKIYHEGRTGELIRCKECKYNNGDRCSYHCGAGYMWLVDDDDFCSCGEREEE